MGAREDKWPADASYRPILARWPSVSALAHDLGLPIDTVYSWRRRDSLPQGKWGAIWEAARVRGYRDVTYRRLRAIAAERARISADLSDNDGVLPQPECVQSAQIRGVRQPKTITRSEAEPCP
jgi:hypothetical protein